MLIRSEAHYPGATAAIATAAAQYGAAEIYVDMADDQLTIWCPEGDPITFPVDEGLVA